MEDEFRDFPDVGIVLQAYLAGRRARRGRPARMGPTPRHADLGAAGEGGLLGLRNGHGPGPRLADSRLPAEMGVRRQLRAADAVPDGELPLAAARAGQPQPAEPVARHRLRRAARRAGARLRAADALRHGGRAGAALGRSGPSRADLHAVRRADSRHGLPRPAAAGKHVERFVPAAKLHRTRFD